MNVHYLRDLELSEDEEFLELFEVELYPRVPSNFRLRENHFLKWNASEFVGRFRLSKETVQFLTTEIKATITCVKNETTSLTADEKVLLTLRFLATGSILQVIGDFAGIDKSTASRTIHQVLFNIASISAQFIKMPDTPAEIKKIQQGFYSVSRFTRCVGAIDCTHVRIQSPGGNQAEIYRNRKGFFSYNVQVVCGHNLIIQDMVCRWPGSAHDSTIFNNSRLRARFENGNFGNGLIVGDSGYAVKKYLITPLASPQTQAEHLFNESQIRTRNPIERCFGVLKRRFPVLVLGIRLHVSKVEEIVVACGVLHNIACQKGEPEPQLNPEIEQAIMEANDVNLNVAPNLHNFNINNITRHNLIHHYFSRL